MVNGIYTATAGMIPRITQMDTVTNNLANTDTRGFKKSGMFLRSLITAQQALDHALGQDDANPLGEVRIDYTQGTFDRTEHEFDLALNGPGFFRVRDAATGDIYYTRDGRFHLDPNGTLMTGKGMQVLDDQYASITIEGNNLRVLTNGDVYVDDALETKVGVADFRREDYPSLDGIGSGLFQRPQAVNENVASSSTQVMQGYLEDANVDPVRGMVDMIEIFRMYELGQKSVQIQDQTLQRVVTEVGVVR